MRDSYDVVVLGSGAAGCTAALTAAVEGASVALLEKGDSFGGTTAMSGGPRTDADARVLDLDGAVIDGLYAAGNAMAGVTGAIYGGAGGTIGPAMTFGFRAGRHAAHARSRLPVGAATR
jgi:succinate dehydrogenase/fumarate reductase flavoprotein subunit